MTEASRFHINEYMAERRKRFCAEGKCPGCGRELSGPFKYCDTCRERNAGYQRKFQAKKRQTHKTNADRIRDMSAYDLAVLLRTVETHIFKGELWTLDAWLKWLQAEYEVASGE